MTHEEEGHLKQYIFSKDDCGFDTYFICEKSFQQICSFTKMKYFIVYNKLSLIIETFFNYSACLCAMYDAIPIYAKFVVSEKRYYNILSVFKHIYCTKAGLLKKSIVVSLRKQ